MAVEITKVFEQSKKYFDKQTLELFKDGQTPFDFPGLKLVESVEGSKAINLIKGSAIIMAGSGMITGGRIKHHLVREITRPESTLIFAGYHAIGTLGRQTQGDHGKGRARLAGGHIAKEHCKAHAGKTTDHGYQRHR